jgi:hypothetical protein
MRSPSRCGRLWAQTPAKESRPPLARRSMSIRRRLALAFVCCLMVAGCGPSGTAQAGTAGEGTPVPTLTPTPPPDTRTPTAGEGTASGGTPGPTLTPTPRPCTATPALTPTALPDRAEGDCAGCSDRPALVLVSYGDPYRADRRSLALVRPDGSELCTVVPPFVGDHYESQLIDERVYHLAKAHRPDAFEALQVVDLSSCELTFLQPELDPALPMYTRFLVSPGGERIAWALWDGAGRSAIDVTPGDGSGARRILEYVGDQWYYLELVRWTDDGDSLFFAVQFAAEGGMLLPQVPGRYISLYRLEVQTGLETVVVPLGDGCTACVADVSPDGRWMAYFLETGTLCLRDLETGEQTLIEGVGWQCCARFSPDSSHLAYVELEGHVGLGGERFTRSRTVMVSVPDGGDVEVIADEAWSMWNRPVGWLDGETPILERIDGARSAVGYLWIAGGDPTEDRFPDCGLVGVLHE